MRSMLRKRSIFAASLWFAAIACRASDTVAPPEQATIKIGAASDLTHAFKDVGAVFETKTGIKPIFTFGSTGLLAKQIAEGAPFDVFAAANVSFADEVIKNGACKADSKALYARGRIVVWNRSDAPEVVELKDLADPRFVKIAIANPEHAPYGKAAQEALKSAGIHDAVKDKLVFGENVSQALQFAQSGNVEASIVALSLAIVTQGGRQLSIDDTFHKAIDQAMVVCSKTDDTNARKFTAFVGSAEGRAIMRRYGFLLPGEKLAVSQ
jgi:molybdate transport system substrate-binding protein